MSATCPVCGCEQGAGLLCADDTARLEKQLGEVPSLVRDLDVTISKQAKIGTPGRGGLAREKSPVHFGALEVADNLTNVLTTWARDAGNRWTSGWGSPSGDAAATLRLNIDAVRRHPAVTELVDEVSDAINQARRIIDRPADRTYLGQCMAEFPDPDGRAVTCLAELWAKVDAHEVACKTCGITHEVTERRAWLLLQAGDQLLTLKEAARVIGSYRGLAITESTIRSYVSKGKLGYHGKVAGSSVIKLSNLMEVVGAHASGTGRQLRRVATDCA